MFINLETTPNFLENWPSFLPNTNISQERASQNSTIRKNLCFLLTQHLTLSLKYLAHHLHKFWLWHCMIWQWSLCDWYDLRLVRFPRKKAKISKLLACHYGKHILLSSYGKHILLSKLGFMWWNIYFLKCCHTSSLWFPFYIYFPTWYFLLLSAICHFHY